MPATTEAATREGSDAEGDRPDPDGPAAKGPAVAFETTLELKIRTLRDEQAAGR